MPRVGLCPLLWACGDAARLPGDGAGRSLLELPLARPAFAAGLAPWGAPPPHGPWGAPSPHGVARLPPTALGASGLRDFGAEGEDDDEEERMDWAPDQDARLGARSSEAWFFRPNKKVVMDPQSFFGPAEPTVLPRWSSRSLKAAAWDLGLDPQFRLAPPHLERGAPQSFFLGRALIGLSVFQMRCLNLVGLYVAVLRRRAWRLWGRARSVLSRVRIPADWTPAVAKRHLRLVHRDRASRVFVGSCASLDEECRDVALKVVRGESAEARREIDMLRRLRGSGNVVTYLASAEMPGVSHILMTAADGTLVEHIRARRRAGISQLPLSESLPILVDLLRGVRDLEKLNIVHGDLSEHNVLMKGGRPLLAHFGTASEIREPGLGLGDKFPDNAMVLSRVLRLPPETPRGLATGPSNNVFQVGVIFASMTLGSVPMLRTLLRELPDYVKVIEDAWKPDYVDKAQRVLRRRFRVKDDIGYKDLADEDTKDILAGLLEVSPHQRWTAVGALAEALAIAKRRGIEVPPERTAPSAVMPWQSDWD